MSFAQGMPTTPTGRSMVIAIIGAAAVPLRGKPGAGSRPARSRARYLRHAGVEIYGFAREIGGIRAETFDRDEIERNIVRSPDPVAAEKMIEAMLAVKEENDSLGGIVEVHALNVPVGLGEPTFDKLDGLIGQAMHSIPAVKGVEIGEGFEVTKLRGSQSNDSFTIENGEVRTPIEQRRRSRWVDYRQASRSWCGWRSSPLLRLRGRSRRSIPICNRVKFWSRAGMTPRSSPRGARCRGDARERAGGSLSPQSRCPHRLAA